MGGLHYSLIVNLPAGPSDDTFFVEFGRQEEVRLLAAQQHTDFISDEFDGIIGPPGLLIGATVYNPQHSIGSKFLIQNMASVAPLLRGRDVLDLGCGCGIIGIIASQLGASHITFSDINPKAVANSKQNASTYGVKHFDGQVSSLFDQLAERTFDVIIANIPGSPGDITKRDSSLSQEGTREVDFLRANLFGPADLTRRFLIEAKQHLNTGGLVIMPTSSARVRQGRPDFLGPRLGYTLEPSVETVREDGLSQSIIVLRPRTAP